MKKLFFLLLIMLSVGLFWGSSVTVQPPEAGRLPVMTATAVPAGEQDGIAQDGNLAVSSERSSLYYDYGNDDANPGATHYFLPTNRITNEFTIRSSGNTLFDKVRDHDAGQAIECQSTHWRSGLDTRPEAVIVRLNDGNPNTRNAGRRLLV